MPIYRLSSPCRWKISQHLIIKYNDWVKHEQTSRTVISKTDLFTPREDKFCEYLHYTPKNISFWLRSRGERNTNFVRFVQILPIFAVKRPDYKRAPTEITLSMLVIIIIWRWSWPVLKSGWSLSELSNESLEWWWISWITMDITRHINISASMMIKFITVHNQRV